MRALQNAYDTIRYLTGGEPPGFVVSGDFSVLGELERGEVMIPEAVWREAVRECLERDGRGASPGAVEVSMRKAGWTVLGVPVDTSRIPADG